MANFHKYVKKKDEVKTPLMYLLLNGYSINNVIRTELKTDKNNFGLEITRTYAVTKDYVEKAIIDAEINAIRLPIVCYDINSFEYNSDSPMVYVHLPSDEEQPLLINDIRIVGKVMAFMKNVVISTSPAEDLISSDTDANNGFMFFYEYVMENTMQILNWKVEYEPIENKGVGTFKVHYISDEIDDNNNILSNDEILYSAINIDKTTTYKIVLYIIKKVAVNVKEWLPDNFIIEQYELRKNY